MVAHRSPGMRPLLLAAVFFGAVLVVTSAATAQGDSEEDLAVAEGNTSSASAEASGDARPRVDDTPTFDGPTGLYRLTSAQTGAPWTLRLALLGEWLSAEEVVRARDENTRFVGRFVFSATTFEWLESYLVITTRSNSNTFSVPETVLSQGDLTLGSKAVFPVAQAFYLGGDLRLLFLTGAGSTSFDFSATSVRLAGLASLDARELPNPVPLRAHLNFGYLVDNSDQLLPEDDSGAKLIPSRVDRFSQGLSAYDQVIVGIGVDVPLPYVTPSLEYNLGILAGEEPLALCDETQPLPCPSEAGFGANPQTMTLGVKGAPVNGFVLNGGIEVGLSGTDTSGVPTTPPWNLMFGLSYVFDPRPKIQIVEKPVPTEPKGPTGPVLGKVKATVLDADTSEPVGNASVTYGEDFTAQSTDPETGSFISYGFPLGREVEITVSHPDYEPATLKSKIDKDEQSLEVTLKPIGKFGIIKGSVKGADNIAADAEVTLTGPRTYTVKPKGGAFEQKVLVGAYTVAAALPGSLTSGRDVIVTAGSTSNIDIVMKKRPATAAVTVSGDKILVEGGIPFDGDKLATGADGILDQVFAAMMEHPEFTRIRIESHVDDRTKDADKLTEARAKAVYDALVQRGVRDDRIEAKGFGASQPLVPNISEPNRAINQRIDFTIVSKSK